MVERNGEERARTSVERFGRFFRNAHHLALGWLRFAEQAMIIFLYDKEDACRMPL